MERGTCRDCEAGELVDLGVVKCRAGLPQATGVNTPKGPAQMSDWPLIAAGEWCMQWSPKAEKGQQKAGDNSEAGPA